MPETNQEAVLSMRLQLKTTQIALGHRADALGAVNVLANDGILISQKLV